MNISRYIAKRYLISKNGKNAINIINILSFTITIIGSAALFIVLSGFSGLKEFSTAFSNYFDPDLHISAAQGKVISMPLSRKRALEQIPGIAVVSGVIEEKVFLNYEEKNEIAYIKGVTENYNQIIATDSILYFGNWLGANDTQVVVGASIANELSLGVDNYGSFLQIMAPKPGKGAINAMNYQRSFNQINTIATDLFSVNETLDSKYIFATIGAARELLNYNDNTYSHIAIKMDNTASEEKLRKQITQIFKEPIVIKNKLQLNDALYKMLNSENLAVYLIFTLVLIIALFNVVGSIIMMILDKKNNLKTLSDLGATLEQLRRIFFYQGSLMTFIGGCIGLLIGILVVGSQLYWEWLYIAPAIPYPFALEWINFVLSLGTIAILGMLASYVASRRINNKLIHQVKR